MTTKTKLSSRIKEIEKTLDEIRRTGELIHEHFQKRDPGGRLVTVGIESIISKAKEGLEQIANGKKEGDLNGA